MGPANVPDVPIPAGLRPMDACLVRIHGKKRSGLLHPLQRKTLKVEQLGINRTTIIFLEDGNRVIKNDEWVSSHQVPVEANGKQWRGFTFFKLKSGHSGQHAGIPEGEE